MISRSGKDNFVKAYYDRIVAGAGVLALVISAVMYYLAIGEDPEESAAESARRIDSLRPSECGVKEVDMSKLQIASKIARNPVVIAEIDGTRENFLASERRVKCRKCKKPIPGDVKAYPVCECGQKQEIAQAVVLDADGDGMPDEWEKKFGLNSAAADATDDKDGDGFTNLEEFQAKTDPSDVKSHPDYLDSLKLTLPLKVTYMPFIFTRAMKLPDGWRIEFFDAKRRNDHGRMGRVVSVRFVGGVAAPVENYGFSVKAYEQKSKKVAIKGGKGMMRTVDVSEVTLERKDGKIIKLVMAASTDDKPAPEDLQATLVYERGGVKEFQVVAGSQIDLNGSKYTIAGISPAAKGARVEIVDSRGKKRVIEALEQ